MAKNLLDKNYRLIVFSFFLAFIITGLSIYKDYGVSADEFISRNNGYLALNFILNGDTKLFYNQDRDYGPAFEMLLAALEKLFLITDTRELLFMRHLVSFILFYISAFFFYLLCRNRFASWKLGLLGSFLLALNPRIFAHSFYNSKDIACLSFFILSIYTLILYLGEKTWPRVFWHAFISAVLVDIRITGIIIPFLTIIFTAPEIFKKRPKKEIFRIILILSTYIFFCLFFVLLFWPNLWTNPIKNFGAALNNMHLFSRGPATILYLGKYFETSQLPWHYIPVWIIISTPLSYFCLFLVGCSVLVGKFFKDPGTFWATNQKDLIFLLWFFLPLGYIFICRPILYDEWRHVFFIYPAFLIIALHGSKALYDYFKPKFQKPFFKAIVLLIIAAVLWNLAAVFFFMISHHPYQNLYFNRLAGKNLSQIKKKFELDYWGLSFRRTLEYLLANDQNKNIRILVSNDAGFLNSFILPASDRKRLSYVISPLRAQYYLSNYRWHPEEYPLKHEFFSLIIDGAKIATVYKIYPGDLDNLHFRTLIISSKETINDSKKIK